MKKSPTFRHVTPVFLGGFLHFCTSGNMKKYFTVYLLNGVVTHNFQKRIENTNEAYK